MARKTPWLAHAQLAMTAAALLVGIAAPERCGPTLRNPTPRHNPTLDAPPMAPLVFPSDEDEGPGAERTL